MKYFVAIKDEGTYKYNIKSRYMLRGQCVFTGIRKRITVYCEKNTQESIFYFTKTLCQKLKRNPNLIFVYTKYIKFYWDGPQLLIE